MNKIKQLLALCLVLLAVSTAQAQWLYTNVTMYGTNMLVLSNRYVISEVTLLSTTNVPVNVQFYDTSYLTNTYTRAAYSNVVYYAYTNNVVFTNDNSVVITNRYPGNSWYMTNVASAVVAYPVIYAANAGTVYSPNYPVDLTVSRGLMISPSTNCVVTIKYRPYTGANLGP